MEAASEGRNSVRRLVSTEPILVANGRATATTASQKPTPTQLANRPVRNAARRANRVRLSLGNVSAMR